MSGQSAADQDAVYRRFLAKVHASASEECHVWTGARNGNGYGSFGGGDGRVYLAHRWLMTRIIGRQLGSREWVLHRCDNPPCVNPEHLYIGTPGDNTRDAVERGRAWTPLAVANAAKTHCPQGHAYDEANTLPIRYGPYGSVGRACRACHRIRERERAAAS